MSTRPATPSPACGPLLIRRLNRRDVDGGGALGTLLGVVLNPGALGEGAEPIARDPGEMDEEVLAGLIGRDEPEALVVAEPLHGAGRHALPPRRRCCERRSCKSSNLLRSCTTFPGLEDPIERATR